MATQAFAGMFRIVIALAAATAVAGCSWAPIRDLRASVSGAFHRDSESALASGIRKYEDGAYPEATKDLQTALELGLWNSDRVRAHKYLAFIYCVSDRDDLCRDEFRRALEIDPRMQLSPAEAGHPTWGPIFRSVKAGR